MSRTRVLIELPTQKPDERVVATLVIGSVGAVLQNSCADLDCVLERAEPTEILADVGATVRLAMEKAHLERVQSSTEVCMYVATRSLVIPWKKKNTFEMTAYIIATVNSRTLLEATIQTRSGRIPAEVKEAVDRTLGRLPEFTGTITITEEEHLLAQRLNVAFWDGLNLAEEVADRSTSHLH